MNKGILYIVSGPSGSGKDTILCEVFAKKPEIKLSISTITRPMREGEKEGEKYHFISREEFESQLKNNMFLEHNVFVGNYYGTPKTPVEECLNSGKDMIVEVDVNGAAQIRAKMPEAVSIFIMPPSFEVLKKRLSGRGTESPELVEKRLNAALEEISRAKEYDYIVINDELDTAVEEFINLLASGKLTYKNKKYIIDEVLKKC